MRHSTLNKLMLERTTRFDTASCPHFEEEERLPANHPSLQPGAASMYQAPLATVTQLQ